MTRWVLCVFLATIFQGGLPSRATAEDVVWVNELETNPKLIGKEIVVEGRFRGQVGPSLDQVRLQNCNPDKIEFRLGPEAERKFPLSLKWIRLNGTLSQSGGKLVMRVTSWNKINSTDEDRFRDIARKIVASDHRAWYELADRTQRLAEFHNEVELKALAQEARLKGFRAEEAALRSTQVDELLKLAERAADVGLDAEESRRMQHKALRWQFDRLKQTKTSASEWSDLAKKITQFLPGAKTPLKETTSVLLQKYREKPIETYDLMPGARDTCDREFWIETTAQSFQVASEQANTDLARLAADAKRIVPDRPELSRMLLKQWAETEAQLLKKWAETDAGRGSTQPAASQVRGLADSFRNQLGEPQRAQEVLRLWLEARRKKLSAKDADGRVRLAKDYRTDMNDDETAAKLLLEAIAIEADLPNASEELKLLGYVKGPNGWVRANDPSLGSKAPGQNASRGGPPTLGMSPEQVREAVGGEPKPEDKIRYTDRGKDGKRVVIENWTYRGPPDIHITFLVEAPSSLRVIAINTKSQK